MFQWDNLNSKHANGSIELIHLLINAVKKIKQGNVIDSNGAGGSLDEVVRKGLSEEVTFEL